MAGRSCVTTVGLAGATCSGKTTLSQMLAEIFPSSVAINQDQFYWPDDHPNHVLLDGFDPAIEQKNWEVTTAFDNQGFLDELLSKRAELIRSGAVEKAPPPRPLADLPSRQEALKKLDFAASKASTSWPLSRDGMVSELRDLFVGFPSLVVGEGILVLNDEATFKACDLKLFLTLDRQTCTERRLRRSYDPPDPPEYFERVAWPYYLKNLEDLRRLDEHSEVVYIDGSGVDVPILLSKVIAAILKDLLSSSDGTP